MEMEEENHPSESRPSMQDFALARVETLSKNIDFAQEQAESLTRRFSEAHLATFSNNVRFVKEQAESLSHSVTRAVAREREDESSDSQPSVAGFVGQRVSVFANNIDFAQTQAEAWTRSVGDLLQTK